GAGNHHSDELVVPTNIMLHLLPPYSPELNPQENLWDEIREKIFKNYALKSMDEVYAKLEQAALYIERNPALVKSITAFPYIAKSIGYGNGITDRLPTATSADQEPEGKGPAGPVRQARDADARRAVRINRVSFEG